MTRWSDLGRFGRRGSIALVALLLCGVALIGCREKVPDSELGRFLARHRGQPADRYRETMRQLASGPAPEAAFAHYELGNIFYNEASRASPGQETVDLGEPAGHDHAAADQGGPDQPDDSRTALFDSALVHFEKAVELDTTFVEAYVNLGSLWDDLAEQAGTGPEQRNLRQQRLDHAKAMYETALALRPGDEKALCNLGSLFMKNRQTGEAVIRFQEALEANPRSSLAHYNLAIVFAEEKMYREAITEWEAAVKADPKGDIGQRSSENIKIVKELMKTKVPENVRGAGEDSQK